ncbi:MAG: HAD-IC family P-type ATPase [Fodinibius sp.]|nr:HAD-IC family P-type ATPase [Fodinibius sp.]
MSALEDEFVLTGLQGMEDPVRPEVVEAVQSARESGIRVIMITGDHLDTAVAIGQQLGLDPDKHGALEGKVLDSLSDEELDLQLLKINIFARVSPKHKYRIVDRLKTLGHVVAVTGDGVNDAPALRAAHLGIAMGKSGTDVAREASDMVLSNDNFATITAAIEEGRIVFSNIRKVTFSCFPPQWVSLL